jgi:prolyl-tRNA synthetase
MECEWPLKCYQLRSIAFLFLTKGSTNTFVQLFRFKDRKEAGYLLSPTHEEEITSLVTHAVKSYKELPVRLYQICKTATFHH